LEIDSEEGSEDSEVNLETDFKEETKEWAEDAMAVDGDDANAGERGEIGEIRDDDVVMADVSNRPIQAQHEHNGKVWSQEKTQ
jgi:hypothetical protein